VKHCVRLRVDRAYREACGSVLLAGATPVREVAGWTGAPAAVLVLMLGPGAAPPPGQARLAPAAARRRAWAAPCSHAQGRAAAAAALLAASLPRRGAPRPLR
jgi:hypothetical protein